jgi:hypothetical protein
VLLGAPVIKVSGMKTRPWYYLIEMHYHDNTKCTRLPVSARRLVSIRGTGELPLCEECARIDGEIGSQLGTLSRSLRSSSPAEEYSAPSEGVERRLASKLS